MGSPRAAQTCRFCDRPATRSLIWSDGRSYTAVCNAHEGDARARIYKEGEGVDDVVKVSQRPLAYRESPEGRMQRALEPAPSVNAPLDENSLGLRVTQTRRKSLMKEAPVAPIGRASAPRGVTFQQRGAASKDIMRTSDKPIRRKGTEIRKRSKGPPGYISGKEIPDNLLQMLGTDWKTMRATRIHDNRISMSIDGVKFSIYTRRG